MKYLSLQGLVKAAREANHNWVAVDKNGSAYSYSDEPRLITQNSEPSGDWFESEEWHLGSSKGCKYIGKFFLICDWKESLFDVRLIQNTGKPDD